VSESEHPRRFLSTLGKAFQVLDAFTAERPELGATQLAAHTGLDRTTIHRFLASLAEIGVLAYNRETRKYRLGLRLLDYSYALLDAMEVRRVAVPHLLRLPRETGKVATLGLPERTDVLIVERLWGQEIQIRLVMQIGARLPMYASAMGRSMLAFQSREEVERILDSSRLEPRTPRTVTDRAAILECLDEIRQRGYDVNDEEAFLGTRAVAVPLTGPGGVPIAAIALMADARTTPLDELTEAAPLLVSVGADISTVLGDRTYGRPLQPLRSATNGAGR
jgi:IclR family transcriptional regulator, pca regulon regulatory protein